MASKRKHTEAPAELEYLHGFGGEKQSEAIKGALPVGQNTPQVCPMDLYAEQLSGTSFTTPRAKNQRSWLYRIRPSVMHEPFVPLEHALLKSNFDESQDGIVVTPNQLRWKPPAMASGGKTDFIDGLITVSGSGSPALKVGMAVHLYSCDKSMANRAFCNADGDMLIVPQQGTLHVVTEFGNMDVPSGSICVIQRGILFSVNVDEPCRGYICEVFNGHYDLPNLGPIGSNGLANSRDFETPVAHFEDRDVACFTRVHKFNGKLFSATQKHSPFDVVAWHGNYAPYRYDLAAFCPVNSVLFDHLDPSIFTVLTCNTDTEGVAACDFVIFPPRWCVQEKTFRPPFYHRNCMSEYMGLIKGQYEAKVDGGFVPGGGSLHSCMTPHGPDVAAFEGASKADLKPVKIGSEMLAFMFESHYTLNMTSWAMDKDIIDADYYKCWQGIAKKFTGSASKI